MAKKKTDLDALFDDNQSENKSQDFASLFESSQGRSEKKLKAGDKLHAEILSIGKEETFVSTGTPIDAVIMNADLLDDKKEMLYKVGDSIEIVVLRASADEIRATKRGSKSAPADIESLEDAFDMELPIEGRVAEVVKGGYRVSVQKLMAFCPISQMNTTPVPKPEDLIGKKFEFLITQFEPQQRNIVLSRRKLLDQKKIEFEGQWMQANKIGDVLSGRVVRLESFGAFVELEGGIQGLVHISEIGFDRYKHASQVLTIDEPVQVKILNITEEGERLKISLSIKQAGGLKDPWVQIVQEYPVGTIFDGTIDKKENYGLFVRILPGVNGLLPKSKWRDAEDSKMYDGLKKGDTVKLRVDEIKFEERKVSLGRPVEGDDGSWREHQSTGAGFSSGMGSLAAAFSKAQKK